MTRCSEKAASFAVTGLPDAKAEAGADLVGEGLAVVADRAAFGDAAHQLGDVGRVEAHDAVIGIGQNLDAAQLIGFGRIERNDVIDVFGDNQRVFGRFRNGLWCQRDISAGQQRLFQCLQHGRLPECKCA